MVRLKYVLSLIVIASLVGSCGGNILPQETPVANAPDGSDGQGAEPKKPEFNGALSEKGNVKFKRQAVLEADIAATLDLPKDSLCNEFGQFSCINDIHHLALGGVDAYDNNIYDAIAEPIATTPVILERIVISACGLRAEKDFANEGSAVVFKGIQSEKADPISIKESITRLYQRALLRNPKEAEINQLIGLHESLQARSLSEPGKQWAQLACYAVLTSVEYIFY
jgi:hypothetical protein